MTDQAELILKSSRRAQEALGLADLEIDKQHELSLVRVYCDLHKITGGDVNAMTHWLRTENNHLDGIPVELIKSDEIEKVEQYLAALTSKPQKKYKSCKKK